MRFVICFGLLFCCAGMLVGCGEQSPTWDKGTLDSAGNPCNDGTDCAQGGSPATHESAPSSGGGALVDADGPASGGAGEGEGDEAGNGEAATRTNPIRAPGVYNYPWAAIVPRPWQNSINPLDVNADGHVSPMDVLVIINDLNENVSRSLPPPSPNNMPPPFLDVSGDSIVSPIDVLLVLNVLNGVDNVEKCTHDDGECPASCNAFTDSDCEPRCGDGFWDSVEFCDAGIPAGYYGACPVSCDDGSPCTTQERIVRDDCAIFCRTAEVVSACINDDGCCPGSCDAQNDNDCSATCGNGTIEPLERCDTAIPRGTPGACPSPFVSDHDCDDGNACTVDKTIYGSADTCGAHCVHYADVHCVSLVNIEPLHWTLDLDGDGMGDPDTQVHRRMPPSNRHVNNSHDCAPADPTLPQRAPASIVELTSIVYDLNCGGWYLSYVNTMPGTTVVFENLLSGGTITESFSSGDGLHVGQFVDAEHYLRAYLGGLPGEWQAYLVTPDCRESNAVPVVEAELNPGKCIVIGAS